VGRLVFFDVSKELFPSPSGGEGSKGKDVLKYMKTSRSSPNVNNVSCNEYILYWVLSELKFEFCQLITLSAFRCLALIITVNSSNLQFCMSATCISTKFTSNYHFFLLFYNSCLHILVVTPCMLSSYSIIIPTTAHI